ncbi:helix-turn-helix domain-containing protein [Enterococcus casseliflavus]|uniref:helix-turn-helix domain-containing protein n=1 Tax=Enterococcus TaxID=1350 RepID=UPI0022B95E02|nr:helix-turn-helix domain-containing protein [Enterococcus innesii]
MKNFQMAFITSATTNRWLKLLNLLERHKTLSNRELSEAVQRSRRTIIYDIEELRSYFGDTLMIESTPNGYSFHEVRPKEYIELKRALLQNEPLFAILEHQFKGEYRSVSEWAAYFYVSESSLLRYLSLFEKALVPFQLSVDHKNFRLIGSETDIRKFFHTFYYESDATPHTVRPTIAVQNIVLDFFQTIRGETNNTSSFWYISYWLYIILERYQAGESVALSEDLKRIVLADEFFQEFQRLNQRIQTTFSLTLPLDELVYLFALVASNRGIKNYLAEISFVNRFDHWPELKGLTTQFCQLQQISDHEKTRDFVFLHSFFITEKIKQLISPTYNRSMEEITVYAQNQYPVEYEENKQFLLNQSIFATEAISARFTLYFEGLKEKYWGTPRRIAFLLEGDALICLHINAFAVKYFGRYHTLHFPDSCEFSLDYVERNKVDLVVTNYAEYLEDYLLDVECLLIKSIPDAEDWNSFLKTINPKIIHNFTLQDVKKIAPSKSKNG